MAFDVSYIFTAKDKYSAVAKKVAAQNEKVRRSAAEASSTIKGKLVPALAAVEAKARGVRNIGLGMTAGVTLPFLLAARSAVNLASDAEETRSKFATVFRDLGDGAENTADSFAKNFGLAGTTARRLIGDTGDLLSGFGFTQEKALDLSRQVNELAVDLASFTNFSGGAEGASAALTKALLGERESLKSLGVAISEDLVKKKIGILQSQGQRFASLAEAKAVATLAIAVDQSKNAIGDYARTQAGAANVARKLSERTIELREKFGKLLLPIQVKINNAAIDMIDHLNALSPTMKKVVVGVGGLLAVIGPLLLVVGSIGLALPVMASGIAGLGVALTFLTGPVGIIIALTAALGVLIMKSERVAAFFSGVGLGIKESVGPALSAVVSDMSAAANIIADLFGPNSDANNAITSSNENLVAFTNAGRLLGTVFGGVLDGIITALRVIGDLIGQTVGAIATMNLDAFDMGSIGDKIKGFATRIGVMEAPAAAASPAVVNANSRATIDGNITVSATEGTRVDSVETNQRFNGVAGNVGMGVAG